MYVLVDLIDKEHVKSSTLILFFVDDHVREVRKKMSSPTGVLQTVSRVQSYWFASEP